MYHHQYIKYSTDYNLFITSITFFYWIFQKFLHSQNIHFLSRLSQDKEDIFNYCLSYIILMSLNLVVSLNELLSKDIDSRLGASN